MASIGISEQTSTPSRDIAVRVSVLLSLIALFLSGWAFLQSWQGDSQLRELETRIACLELSGSNDCGLDGR